MSKPWTEGELIGMFAKDLMFHTTREKAARATQDARALNSWLREIYDRSYPGYQASQLLRLVRDFEMSLCFQDILSTIWGSSVVNLALIHTMFEARMNSYVLQYLNGHLDKMKNVFGEKTFTTVQLDDLKFFQILRNADGSYNQELGMKAFFPLVQDTAVEACEEIYPIRGPDNTFIVTVHRLDVESIQLPDPRRQYRHPKILCVMRDDKQYIHVYKKLFTGGNFELLDGPTLKAFATHHLPIMSTVLRFLFYLIHPSFQTPENASTEYQKLDYCKLFKDLVLPLRRKSFSDTVDERISKETDEYNKSRGPKVTKFLNALLAIVSDPKLLPSGTKTAEQVEAKLQIRKEWRGFLSKKEGNKIIELMKSTKLFKPAVLLFINHFGLDHFQGIGCVFKLWPVKHAAEWFDEEEEEDDTKIDWEIIDYVKPRLGRAYLSSQVRKSTAMSLVTSVHLQHTGASWEAAARVIFENSRVETVEPQEDLSKGEQEILDECVRELPFDAETLNLAGYNVFANAQDIRKVSTEDEFEAHVMKLPQYRAILNDYRIPERKSSTLLQEMDYQIASNLNKTTKSTGKRKRD